MSQAFTQGFIIKDGQRVIDSSVGALTVQGDVNIGANALRTTNLLLNQRDANTFQILNSAATANKNMEFGVAEIVYGVIGTFGDMYINARNADTAAVTFGARDSGVGIVEVARLMGAAAPAFCVGNSGATANDDFASIADQVKLGNYDIAAGRRTLALATEEAVAIDVILASTHTLSVRLNGTTYKILLST
jgi:hypothetical protein